MDVEAKAKWLEALRSGRYTQCGGALKAKSGFCCLGVLLDAVGDGKWQRLYPEDDDLDESERYVHSNSKASRGYLHGDFLDEMGLNEDEQQYLANMNDNGKSFAEIADHIEKNL